MDYELQESMLDEQEAKERKEKKVDDEMQNEEFKDHDLQ